MVFYLLRLARPERPGGQLERIVGPHRGRGLLRSQHPPHLQEFPFFCRLVEDHSLRFQDMRHRLEHLVAGLVQAGHRHLRAHQPVAPLQLLHLEPQPFVRFLKSLVPVLQLLPILPDTQVGAHPGLDLHDLERLGDIVHGPQLEPTGLVLDLVQGGDKDHRDIAGPFVRFQSGAHLVPVYIGHHDVEQHQVDIVLLQILQRLGAAGGHAQPVIVAQGFDQDGDVRPGVVDDQHPGSSGWVRHDCLQ